MSTTFTGKGLNMEPLTTLIDGLYNVGWKITARKILTKGFQAKTLSTIE